ncbi:MAG: Ig-like domain repeat protein [Planctomycetia bacterium]|nr:Ig-like domain repeat protein [Planctomycetia bacterium]
MNWLQGLRRAFSHRVLGKRGRLWVEKLEARETPAAFTPGNLAVLRVGTGSAGLTNAATACFIDEYTTKGTFVQSIPLPTADNGTNQTLTMSGTSTSDGQITRSSDGRYLVVTGYDAAPGTASVTSTTTSITVRTIGRVDSAGTIDTTTTTTSFSANNIRSGTSVDGNTFWLVGANTGVVSCSFGSSGTGTVISTTQTNNRVVQIYNGQLYVSSGSGTNTTKGVNQVGTGTPTSTSQTMVRLPGLSDTSTPSSYSFFLADLDIDTPGLDTLYIADDNSTAGGILKFSFVSGSWFTNDVVGAGFDSYRGLTGTVTNGVVTLYATRKGGSVAAGGGELVSIIDNTGYNRSISSLPSPTLLVSASANTAFRGVALVPELPPDTTPPVVSSIVRKAGFPNPTNANSIDFTVTISEAVTGVDIGDFALAGATSGATITNVTGSGSTYTVTVATGVDGSLGLNLVDNDSIVDGAGNKLGGTGTSNGNFTGQTYTIDKTAPTVVSIVRAAQNPTNAASVAFTVTFSEAVTGVDANDFALDTTGVSGATIGSITGSGVTYSVSLNTGTCSGTVSIDLASNPTIQDAVGNMLIAPFTNGETYTIDRVRPQVSGITLLSPNPATSGSVDFLVTFSESVNGVDATDFAIFGSSSGAAITNVSGSGADRVVTLLTGSGGTLGLNVLNDNSITDMALNTLADSFDGSESYQILSAVETMVSLTANATRLLPGRTLTLTASLSSADATGNITFFINNNPVNTVSLTGNIAQIIIPGLPVGRYNITARYEGDSTHLPKTSSAVRVEVGSPSLLFVLKAFQALTGLNQSPQIPSWVTSLESGRLTRSQVVMAIQRTPEYFSHIVNVSYLTFLGRLPTPAEASRRASILAGGQSVPQFQAWLMGQQEYYVRQASSSLEGFRRAVAFDLTREVHNPTIRSNLVRAILVVPLPARLAVDPNFRTTFVLSLMNQSIGQTALMQGLWGRFQDSSADDRLLPFRSLLGKPLGYAQVIAALLGSTTYAP